LRRNRLEEMRQAMQPADQFEAFKKIADEGQGPDTIAAKFGVTPHVVEQRREREPEAD
jgi:ParB family chromosome partitioning protein